MYYLGPEFHKRDKNGLSFFIRKPRFKRDFVGIERKILNIIKTYMGETTHKFSKVERMNPLCVVNPSPWFCATCLICNKNYSFRFFDNVLNNGHVGYLYVVVVEFDANHRDYDAEIKSLNEHGYRKQKEHTPKVEKHLSTVKSSKTKTKKQKPISIEETIEDLDIDSLVLE